jgi:hypothetical protein
MLSREVMGVLALGILWVNTLLIAAAAWKDLWALWSRRARMTPIAGAGIGLARARVVRGAGDGGLLAALRVEQVGRAEEGETPAILFADRAAEGEVFGGVARLAPSGVDAGVDAGVEVEIEATRSALVWVEPEELRRAAACPSAEAFARAYDEALKARGVRRAVSAGIGMDREVFLFGHFRPKGTGLALEPPRGEGVLIAALDPRRWILGKMGLLAAFLVAELALAGGCTAVALARPHFGLVSSIGGALCLGYFLLVQPAGTMVRAAVETPERAFLGGRWALRRRLAGALSVARERGAPTHT